MDTIKRGFAIAWLVIASPAFGQTDIEPSQGLEHVGKKVRVTFTVFSMGRSGENCELNSLESWKEPDCLMVHLTPAVQTAFNEQGVSNLVEHFSRKKVVVTGTLREINPGGMKRASILISSPDDIRFVLVSTRKAPDIISELRDRRIDLRLKNDQFLADVLVTAVETRGEPIGILSLKVRSGDAVPKAYGASSIEEIYVDDIPLDLTYERKARLLTVDDDKRAARLKQSEEMERRVQKRGGKYWEYLSADEQAARIAKGKEFLTVVQKQFPDCPLKVVETKYYLLISDLDPGSAQQYLQYLDSLYDEMCRAFGVPLGKNIWAGKCIVATFQMQADFLRFEKETLKNTREPEKSQGLCHAQTD